MTTATETKAPTDAELQAMLEDEVTCTRRRFTIFTGEVIWECNAPADWVCRCLNCNTIGFKCDPCIKEQVALSGGKKPFRCTKCHITSFNIFDIMKVVGRL